MAPSVAGMARTLGRRRHCQPKPIAADKIASWRGHMAKSTNPFRYFDSSPEVIRTVVMMSVKYPLSLRNVENLLAERCCHVK